MKDIFEKDDLTRDFLIILAVVVVAYVNFKITPINIGTVTSGSFFQDFFAFIQGKLTNLTPLQEFLMWVKSVLAVFSVLLILGIVFVHNRMHEVQHKLSKIYKPINVEEVVAKDKAIQWQIVLNHVSSGNPAEWKLAVLEADNILDSILEDRGYRGESLGERLKSVDPGDMQSYSDAWEAHKVRNQIAHEGSNMDFSEKIARDAINRYEKVFKELGYL
ncbi:MAG: hypothetical protein AAB628_02100 [Patescibacteria group bacterium]